MTPEQQKQLVQYYKTLDDLYTKIAGQAVNDMNNLLKRLQDGTVIYLEKSKRNTPKDQFLIQQGLTKQETADFIESKFKAGRINMITSQEIS